MNTTARQEQLARAGDNRRYVRELLTERQPAFCGLLEAVVHAMHRERTAALPSALRDHAFGRSGCKLAGGEPLLAARSRGYAAESAIDAVTAIRDGDMADARALLRAALSYLDTRDARMAAS